MPQYCNQGHENPDGSRFCLQCGEQLALAVSQGIYPGLILGNRYRIVRQLGQGGFGRTYLAEDTNRFSESCVLKEFAPLGHQSTYALQKAEELFEREAGVLYQLQHPQIPRFRELFRVNLDGKGYLFLVQDYVEGQTYRNLLEARKRQGLTFNEPEINQLLLQLLPVLEYIHSNGVIHRDISPDNLMLRSSDYLPVLIDFGGVKQVAATVASQYALSAGTTPPATLLGKVGYAPHEQMQLGVVYPHSDLYALAVTVLVLLTGKEPQELIDNNTLAWNWRREVNLNPTLATILDKMLLPRPGDRYQSASQVLQALTATSNVLPNQSTEATVAVGRRVNYTPNVANTIPAANYAERQFFTPSKILLVVLVLLSAGGAGWLAVTLLQSRQATVPAAEPTPSPTPTAKPTTTPSYSSEELARRQALFQRGRDLGISKNFLFGNQGLVYQVFNSQHPELQQRLLSPDSADTALRSQWYKTADGLLDRLENSLSLAARQQLGSYTLAALKPAVAKLKELHLSNHALNDLTDAQFFNLFPEQRGQNFIQTPLGQIWQAIASDKVKAIQAGTILERIVFDAGATGKSVSGTLKPGNGKAYIAGLAKGQMMKVDLQANSTILLSIYSPSGQTKILENSSDRTWKGELPEDGFYEFIIVSTASEPIDYQLRVTAENLTPTPSTEPSPSDTSTPSPSATTPSIQSNQFSE